VPLARDLHPEFGYVGSAPRLCRKLGLGLAFVAFGLVAAASGLSVFMAAPDPDPTQAMALAPADALVDAKSSNRIGGSPNAPEQVGRTQSASEQKTDKWEERDKTAAIRQSCRDTGAEQRVGCKFIRPMKTHPAQALNVPIGHRDESAILPSAEPPVSVAAIPQPEEVSPAPEAPPVTAATPAPAAKKARAKPQHSQRREAYAPSHSYGYRSYPQQGGYAGVY
jgi:hypothetical protein